MRNLNLKPNLFALSLMLSGGAAFGDYDVPPMDKVFSVATSIADVSVASLDEKGNANLTIHQEIKGKQPKRLVGISLSCFPVDPRLLRMKLGRRYLVICQKDLLYESSAKYEIRVRDGIAECLFHKGNVIWGKRQWTSLENVRKRISDGIAKNKGKS